MGKLPFFADSTMMSSATLLVALTAVASVSAIAPQDKFKTGCCVFKNATVVIFQPALGEQSCKELALSEEGATTEYSELSCEDFKANYPGNTPTDGTAPLPEMIRSIPAPAKCAKMKEELTKAREAVASLAKEIEETSSQATNLAREAQAIVGDGSEGCDGKDPQGKCLAQMADKMRMDAIAMEEKNDDQRISERKRQMQSSRDELKKKMSNYGSAMAAEQQKLEAKNAAMYQAIQKNTNVLIRAKEAVATPQSVESISL